jgi:hypothetical protein
VPQFKWSEKRREYIYGNSRAVPAETLDGWIAAAAEKAEARMRGIAQRFADGEINYSQWVIDSKNEIRVAARGMAQIAYGGKLTPKQAGRLGAMVKVQYGFFNDFAALVESGQVLPGQGLIGRAGLYGANAYPIYQYFVGDREKAAGAKEERNILGSRGASCSGCIGESARGWVKIGKMIPIGSRQCRARCRCRRESR